MKIFRNYRVKINLILLAIFLWLFVVTSREYEIEMDIPLVVKNIKPGKTLANEIPATARVLFKGIGRGLIAIQTFEKAQLELDLSTINFFFDYPIKLNLIKFSSNLNVEPIQIIYPDTVKITLEKLVEANVDVKPVTAVSTIPGYVVVGEAKATPAKVIVSGPASIMKDVEFVETTEINRSDLQSDLKEKAKIILPHSSLKASLQEVTVVVKVERLTEVNFRSIPVSVENPPGLYSVRLEPETVSVKVRGSLSKIKNLSENKIKATISFPGQWCEDITKCAPQITLPEGIELIIVEPDSVTMTLIEEQ